MLVQYEALSNIGETFVTTIIASMTLSTGSFQVTGRERRDKDSSALQEESHTYKRM